MPAHNAAPARNAAVAILSATLVLAGCAGRPDDRATGGQAPRTTSVPTAECLVGLTATDAQFSMLPDRYPAPGCSNANTVQVSSLAADNGTVAVGNIGPLTCEVSTAFAGWVRYGADRAARAVLGSPLRSVETMGSYSCRNVAGTNRRSAHSTASAVDIGAFVLQDGRRITVLAGWNGGTPAEQEFLRTVQRSGCRRFATVLGPEYNAAHRDHLHLEGVAGSGGSFCR